MGMPRTISLSSSPTPQLHSGSGIDNGFSTDPQLAREMDPSRTNMTECSPPVVEIVDDDSKQADNSIKCDTSEKNASKGDASSLGGPDTIPVKTGSDTKIDSATILSKPSSGGSVEIAKKITNAAAPTDDAMGNGNENKQVFANNYDAIADIAASSHVRSRRKKRERSEISTSLKKPDAVSSNHMPILRHPPTIVTASMSSHYVPPRLQTGTGSAKNYHAFNRTEDKSYVAGSTGRKNKVSVHMLNSVGLECGDDGLLRLERFDDDDNASICGNDDVGVEPIKTENETGKQKPPMWTLEQHKAFAAAIFEIGLKNCSPSIIMENMRRQPRYITRERTKSHLQKYRQTKERSKGEFLKEFDAFFKATEEAKAFLNNKNSDSSAGINHGAIGMGKNFKAKEPIPKAVLTTALEGKKPSKLLGGKAAALLSYSVLNGFSTSHGPDQMQYKAAKFSEFPSMTEAEKRSSVGASLLQVKSLIDNMTDILLKTRHGIKAIPMRRIGIRDDESVSSSMRSSDDEYSDEDEENNEGGGKMEKHQLGKSGSKDQDPMTAAAAASKRGGPFQIGPGMAGPGHPMYGGPPTVFPAPFSAQGAAPPAATGFPPPQFPHTQPPFYGGAPPPSHLQPPAPGFVAPAPGFVAPTGFHHPSMHYPQDPRMNPYQQAQPAQMGSYPGVPPIQPNYYPAVAGYPAYYGSVEGNMNQGAINPGAEYPPQHHVSGDVFEDNSRHRGDGQHQQTNLLDQQSPPHSNSRNDNRAYNVREDSTEKSKRRRSGKRSKRRRNRDERVETPLSIDTSDLQKTGDSDFGDFLDRLGKIPSPSKDARKSSSSPIQRSRHHGRSKSSPPLHSEGSPTEKQTKKRSRKMESQEHHKSQQQYQSQFDSSTHSESYAKTYGSPETDPFLEGGGSNFAATYEISPSHRIQSEQNQSQAHVNQQQHGNNSGQFWESSNFVEAGYNNQQQPQNVGGGEFRQHPAQSDAYNTESDHQQQQNRNHYDEADGQQHSNSEVPMYLKGAQLSPEDSTRSFFFRE